TPRELLVKFVRRNKAFSAVSAAALLVLTGVLVFAFHVNYSARLHAETAQEKAETASARLEREQREKDEAVRQLIPATIGAARHLANDRQTDEAVRQIDAALALAPYNPEAHLLKAQILIARTEWPAARSELEWCLKRKEVETEARKLLKLCPEEADASPAV